MPVILSIFLRQLFWQVGVPTIIFLMRKLGLIGWADAMAVKAIVGVKNLKKEYKYPTGKNGQFNEPTVSQSNINRGADN